MARQPHPVYHRTPSPAGAQPRVGWTILCWMLIVFSPFIGFAIHGKVEEPGLIIGLCVAVLPACALVWLGLQHRAARRRVPAEVLAEWRDGRLIAPEGAPPVAPPLRLTSGRHWVELRADGVLVSRSALLQLHGTGSLSDRATQLLAADAAGQYFVPWSDIATWEVTSGSDGPDFHRLLLRPQGAVHVRRFQPNQGHEADLLDGVRAIGQVPVRLHDDLNA